MRARPCHNDDAGCCTSWSPSHIRGPAHPPLLAPCVPQFDLAPTPAAGRTRTARLALVPADRKRKLSGEERPARVLVSPRLMMMLVCAPAFDFARESLQTGRRQELDARPGCGGIRRCVLLSSHS